MKYTTRFSCALILFLCAASMAARAQFDKDTVARKIYHAQDSISRWLFLNAEEMGGMQPNSPQKTRQVWHEQKNNTKGLLLAYDIRLKFGSHTEALAFQTDHIAFNSEGMKELTGYKLDTTGCAQFHVYKDPRMAEMLGMKMMPYCVLLVSGNYFIKFFATSHEDFKDGDLQPYISAIVRRMKAQ